MKSPITRVQYNGKKPLMIAWFLLLIIAMCYIKQIEKRLKTESYWLLELKWSQKLFNVFTGLKLTIAKHIFIDCLDIS